MTNNSPAKMNPQSTFDPDAAPAHRPHPLDLNDEHEINISTEDTGAVQAALDTAQGTCSSALLGSGDVELAATLAEDLLNRAFLTVEERVGTKYVFFSTALHYLQKTDVTEGHLTRESEGWSLTFIERTSLSGKPEGYLVASPSVPPAEELGKRAITSSGFRAWPDTSLFSAGKIY
jgi:hypothetical protein